jgi:CubicO group peptidase (beta-lactamase class C family)
MSSEAPMPVVRPPIVLEQHDVETFVDGLMADQLRTGNIAGAVVAVVANGNILLTKGYGYADFADHRPAGAQTLFRPGSVSKLFTFTAVMQLVEQHRLDLDTDVNTYLKAFKIPADYPEPVTLRHLITHTAGFENINVQLFAPDAGKLLPLRAALQINMPRRVRPPGLYSSYSNYGVALAGLIVEEVSGESFDSYVEEHIFKPLGMTHSTFREPLPAPLAAQMSQGYVYGAGAFVPLGFEYLHNTAPAGSASATAEDMAKFMIAHLQNGEYGGARILREETARRMHSRLFANDTRLPGIAYGFNEGSVNGHRFLAHRGDTQWFHSDLHLLLDEDIGLFISYNTPVPGGQREAFLQAFMDRYFPRPPVADPQPPADFARRAGRYVGDYQNMSRSYTTFEKFEEFFGNGRRSIALTPQNTLFLDAGYASMQFVEVAPDRFQQVGGQEQMIFRRDSAGRVVFFLSSWPATTVEKLAGWTNPTLQKSLLALCMLAFLASLATLYVTRREAVGTPAQRWLRGFIGGVSFLNVLFCGAFIHLYLTQQGDIYLYGLPWTLKLLMLLPIGAAVATLGTMVLLTLAWARGLASLYVRAQYTVTAMAGAYMVWFAQYYNLFGPPV